MAYYTIDECVQHVVDVLSANKATLGPEPVKDVYYGDDDRIDQYPAIVVGAGPLDRRWARTGYFELAITLNIFVFHANLNISRQLRTKNDLQAVKEITKLLHTPPHASLGGNIIQALVTREEPGRLARPTGDVVIGTRLVWQGTVQEPLTH